MSTSTPTIERLTVTMPSEMASLIREAVAEGDYASSSEVIREAMRDWKRKRTLQMQSAAELQTEIDRGMADMAVGRTTTFDAARIAQRGRKSLIKRSSSG